MAEIAVVDFSKEDCWKPGTSSWVSARRDVCRALEEFGCFTAVMPDNKLPVGLHDTLFGTFDELFSFPFGLHDTRLGYAASYSGQQAYGIINGTNTQDTLEFTRHFWPNGNDLFRESVDLYAKAMEELDHVVTRMVFENYGVEKYHEDHVKTTMHHFKMLKYKESKKSETDVGLRSHTDKTFSNIFLQNHVKGLEFNLKDDEWVPFDPPQPSSVIYIAGDAFQIWSNGRIRSIIHRVTLRENDIRYTFGVVSINKGVLKVPDELVDEDHPLLYKPLNHLPFLQSVGHIGETIYAAQAYCAI